MAWILAEGGPQPPESRLLDSATFQGDSKRCIMEQQWKEAFEKSKQTKLLTKHLSTTSIFGSGRGRANMRGTDPSRMVWCAAVTISAASQPRWELQSVVLLFTVRGSPGLTANMFYTVIIRPGWTSHPSFKKNCSCLCPGCSKHRNLRRHRICV